MKFSFTYYRTNIRLLFGLIVVLLFSCEEKNDLVGSLVVTEPAGITRQLEYVEVEVLLDRPLLETESLFLKDDTSDVLIGGQILSVSNVESGDYSVRCIFPISIQAGASKHYKVLPLSNTVVSTDLKVGGEGLELTIENEHYVANLTSEMATSENGIGPGQLTSLSLKVFNNILLKRNNIDMHWAPSFQKEGLDYKTMAHLRDPDSVSIERGNYIISTYRSGKVKGYEEIQLEGEYTFYAGLPYFIFSSSMTMVDDVVLTMLRNDEMTMDSLFTHAIYPLPNGDFKTVTLYDAPPLSGHHSIKELRKAPIDANVDWFCFYNDSLKYALGSVRIEDDYTNSEGNQSPMINPETRISYATKGGRYWDRRFVFSREDSLSIPKGSRYYEKNAYVIFQVNAEDPAMEIKELFMQLTQPVQVEYTKSK